MSRVRPEYTLDFSGGLNLRDDVFGLADNESPELLNVEIDGRGGFRSRRPWQWVGVPSYTGTQWEPRDLIERRRASGDVEYWLLNWGDIGVGASDDINILRSTNSGYTWTEVMTWEVLKPTNERIRWDWTIWGDTLYVHTGYYNVKFTAAAPNGAYFTSFAFSEIDSPSTNRMPPAEVAAVHMGYMFLARLPDSSASTTIAQTRLRWSHPNQPEAWRESDYIDIDDGGGVITALVSNGDHLLIFQENSIKALFGYDADSFHLVEVSPTLGCPSRSAVCQSEDSVYFYSQPSGIYRIQGSSDPVEISEKIRPLVNSEDFNEDTTTQVFLGWLDRKLWVSIPYYTTAPTETRTTLQWDPSIGNGVWTVHRTGTDYGLGPFLEGGDVGGENPLACLRGPTEAVMNLNGRLDGGYDKLPTWTGSGYADDDTSFEAYLRTKWVDGGAPTLKKQWRRPDFLVKDFAFARNMTIDAYRDYDPTNVARTKTLAIASSANGGDTIYRGGSLGPARAVQLKLSGEAGYPWGVDAIVFKFVPRRMR